MTSLSEIDSAIKAALADHRTNMTHAVLLLAGATCQVARSISELQATINDAASYLTSPDANRIRLDVAISDIGLNEDRHGEKYLAVQHAGIVVERDELP